MCDVGFKCKFCDRTFDKKRPLKTTAFHQIKKDLTTFDGDKAKMIVDLGCPNSVLGVCDVETFRKCLSHFQQENMEMLDVDEKFKFGPSGPYKCSKKMRIPIGTEKNTLWVTVAIVDAKIPMLLGNNILKPLEAKIELFSTGNGVVVLEDEEIDLEETGAGHYTVRVSDLGKLCKMPTAFDCFDCELEFRSRTDLKRHMDRKHVGMDTYSSTLKCKDCDKNFKTFTSRSIHRRMKHGIHDNDMQVYHSYACDGCDEVFRSKRGLSTHKETKHEVRKPIKSAMKVKPRSSSTKHDQIMKDIEGELSFEKINKDLNTMMNSSPSNREKKMIKLMRDIATLRLSCDKCEQENDRESHIQNHEYEEHSHQNKETETIFLSHHAEEIDDSEIELDPIIWAVFLNADDAKELTAEEKKEVLKLHKYFAHRNAKKLWDNMFLPAGR